MNEKQANPLCGLIGAILSHQKCFYQSKNGNESTLKFLRMTPGVRYADIDDARSRLKQLSPEDRPTCGVVGEESSASSKRVRSHRDGQRVTGGDNRQLVVGSGDQPVSSSLNICWRDDEKWSLARWCHVRFWSQLGKTLKTDLHHFCHKSALPFAPKTGFHQDKPNFTFGPLSLLFRTFCALHCLRRLRYSFRPISSTMEIMCLDLHFNCRMPHQRTRQKGTIEVEPRCTNCQRQ